MKAAMPIILGFIILIAVSLISFQGINKDYQKINSELSKTEDFIIAGDWAKAGFHLKQSQSDWSKARKWWAIFINHSTINNIEICYKKLERYIDSQKTALSLAELEALKVLIKDVPGSEELSIVNILILNPGLVGGK